jgi:hypothetical protein
MNSSISFHRLESWSDNQRNDTKSVLVSFETRQHGYLQVEYRRESSGQGAIKELRDEPDLMMLTDDERYCVECLLHIVYRIVFDSGKSKVLSGEGV